MHRRDPSKRKMPIRSTRHAEGGWGLRRSSDILRPAHDHFRFAPRRLVHVLLGGWRLDGDRCDERQRVRHLGARSSAHLADQSVASAIDNTEAAGEGGTLLPPIGGEYAGRLPASREANAGCAIQHALKEGCTRRAPFAAAGDVDGDRFSIIVGRKEGRATRWLLGMREHYPVGDQHDPPDRHGGASSSRHATLIQAQSA